MNLETYLIFRETEGDTVLETASMAAAKISAFNDLLKSDPTKYGEMLSGRLSNIKSVQVASEVITEEGASTLEFDTRVEGNKVVYTTFKNHFPLKGNKSFESKTLTSSVMFVDDRKVVHKAQACASKNH